ncbi:phage tail protein [Klebsiella pneumoniae]|uniref:phage tail protein n=1 Tax=Klebsiella TaxID=570 RepID=UPI0015DCA159|nr:MULTISPECIES: phage tail protein [Klebsiella]HCP7680484.1 phage tail protein [Escherichia coli]HDT5898953.1 phage tail protein [Raoultella ornithinolytica]MBD7346128.1 phage tail protein [Klebsiella pneumoniae]MBD7356883.1 phage tail protein [Klebsiella pneumoniae]MBD7367514.1 phage tail protein [Klebsiella pneumoniae]
MVTETELIEFDLLQKFGERWKYRYSAGAKYIFASSKALAIEGATEAFRKALPGELLTREERYEKANQEDIERSDNLWKHLNLDDLQALFSRMGGDIKSLQRASLREFTGNGGRRTSSAVAAQGARDTALMCMRLERYIQWRQEK